ncbi:MULTISPECIES: TIGR04222 domain-containing membrane protein [Actinosynnema]|uniref:TIGR04222 domain-containing membrane protein n=1 Tax=Actinosynnema TaxID=40566 RepID=UPI0020A4E5F1|nr:TIGR04222 domain-containing membrane protein [Actinosynnema pretiosum]MCP2095500.1 TIGR04222 domain-containing protein [Actinosynnema pretiosum]
MTDAVFALVLGVLLLGAVVVGARLKRVAGTAPQRVLTFEEVGYLGGGPVRAVEVALASLVGQNRVRVSGGGVVAVDLPEEREEPSALAAELLAGLDRPRGVGELLVGAAASGPARAIGRELVRAGLLVPPRARLRRAALAVAPLLVPAALSVVRLGAVGVVGLVLTGVAAVVLLLGAPPVLTRAGSRALADATAGLAPVGPAEVAARFGLAAAVRGSVREAPREQPGTRAETAVFDGERAEPIGEPETSHGQLPRRRRPVEVEPQRWQRGSGLLAAGGWFVGGWLAAEWVEDWDGDFGGGGDAG